MKQVNENDIKELAAVHDLFCVSVFIPTHSDGDKHRNRDSLLLKDQLKEIKNKLVARGFVRNEIDNFLTPIIKLIDDSEYWSLQSGGLAIFLSDKLFKSFELPIQFEPFLYVSSEFYVEPLFSAVANTEDFFLLSLEIDNVRLYKGSRAGMEEMNIAEMIPSKLEEVVGSDYEQNSLQFKSQQPGYGHSVFYGHAAGDANKTEIKKYLREVDKGIAKLLKDEKAPVLVAAADDLFSAYREVNTLGHLYDGHISGNPKLVEMQSLHKDALHLLQPAFNKTKIDKTESFRQLQGKGSTSNRIEEILPAAIHGKIDSLFILKNHDVFGMYDNESNLVKIGSQNELAAVSLFNFAAKEAFLNGANIYLVEKEEMPDGFSTINALYRY